MLLLWLVFALGNLERSILAGKAVEYIFVLKKDEPSLYPFAESNSIPGEGTPCYAECRIEHGQNVSLRMFQALQSGHTISSGGATHTPDQNYFINTMKPTPTPTNIVELNSTTVEYTNQEISLWASDNGTGFDQVFVCEMNDSCVIHTNNTFCSSYSLECTLKQPRICNKVLKTNYSHKV